MAHLFDTFKLVDRLKAAGFASEQAEAIVRIISEAQDDLVTRKDLQIELAPVRTDSAVLKWMMGVLLAGVMSLILKAFTVHSHQPSLSMPPKAFKPFRHLHTFQRITPSIPWDRVARFHWEGPLARGQSVAGIGSCSPHVCGRPGGRPSEREDTHFPSPLRGRFVVVRIFSDAHKGASATWFGSVFSP